MKIRAQVIAGIVIFAILLVIISGLIISTNQQLDELMVQEDLANSIALETGELSYLSNDYILYREPQQAERWNAKFAEISGDIANLSVNQPEQQVIAAGLAANLKNTRAVFDDIASDPVLPGGADTAFVQLSWSRMAVQNQGMIFDAGRLARLLRDEETGLRAERTYFIFALMGAFVAFLLTSYFLGARRMLRSVKDLQQGANIVGSGDFSHTIEVSSDDEVGELSRSFNTMVADLRTVTASKADLEREIAGRKLAEEDLVRANEVLGRSETDLIQKNIDLHALNEELTATQDELQQNIDRLTRAERSLRESEERYRTVADFTRDWEFWTDPDGNIRYLSPSTERVLGRPVAGVTSLEDLLQRVVHPDDLGRRLEHVAEEKAATGPGEMEYRIVRPGGEVRWIHHICQPVFDTEGDFLGTRGSNRDITDRKLAEEALRKALLRTSTVLEGIADTFYSVDERWRFTMVNPAAEKAPFGRPAAELLGRVIWDLYPALVGTTIHRHYLDAAKNRTMEHYEAQSPLDQRWYEVFMQGREEGVDVYMRDITERKRAEETLRETSQYLESLITYANAPIIVWDPAFRITRFNQAFEDLTGIAAGEAIGQPLTILFPEKYRAQSMEVIRRTMQGERLKVVEIPILRKDGNIRVVLWNSATLFGQDGARIVSTIAQGQDITERKIAEAENIRARAEWERTFNTVPDLIAILDTKHRIIRVNKAMADRLGATPETCIGLPCHQAVHGTSVPPQFCPHTKTCADGQQHIAEVYEPGLGGTFIVSTTPLTDPAGNLLGTVHVAHDITDRKRAEEELRQRHEDLNAAYEEIAATQEELQQNLEELSSRESQLQEALDEKEILLSEIHHRVKNNLTAFISLLSLEGSYEETESGRALKKDLQNRARSMALIHETLYRTRKFSSVEMETYLTTLVSQIAGSYAGHRAIRTLVEAPGTSLDLGRATTAGLIINELVTNSFKYAFPAEFDCMAVRGEPCTIRVTLTGEDGALVLTVADNGCGLPPGFDPLSTKSLGLKLVNFLARHQLRAAIEVGSGCGTTFIFRLQNPDELQ